MELKKNKRLDIQYSLIQALYYGVYCSLIGYASVFLLDKGYSNSAIGIIIAVASILSTVIQPVMAGIIDKNKKIDIKILTCGFLLVMLGLVVVLMFLTKVSLLLSCVFVIASTILMCIVPLINAMTFIFEKQGFQINFGVARGIGSTAYALASLGLGYFVEAFSPSLMPIVYIVGLLGLIPLIYTFVLKDVPIVESKEEQLEEGESISFISFIVKYKKFVFMFVGAVLLFFGHSLVNNFFIQVIEAIGGSSSDMGKAIFIAAMVELPVMSMFDKIREKINCGTIMKISAIMFTAKILLTYLAPNMMILYVAQFLQIGAYALFIPASVYYVSMVIQKGDMMKGQSIATMSITLGSVFASLSGGILLDGVGVHTTLLISVIISIIGTFVVLFTSEKV